MVERRNQKNPLGQSPLLRQRRISTNQIWIDTSSGGMRLTNINRSIQITNLPLQKSHLPLNLRHNPIPLSFGNDTSNNPYRCDTSTEPKAGSISLIFHWFPSLLWSLFRHALPGCFLDCYLDLLCCGLVQISTHGRYDRKTFDKSIY